MAARLPSTARLALAAAVVLGIAGCNLGPRYHTPSVPAPASWDTPGVETVTTWPAAGWWQQFNSRELDELITQAQAANDDLAAAVSRVRQADALVRVNSAPLLPSLDGTASATRQRMFLPLNGGTLTFDQYEAQLNASYQIDFWGKNLAARAAALANAEASRFDRATVELTVMSSVATTYFQVLELRDRVNIAHDNLASAQVILKGLKAQQAAGIANALDVAQQETTVATLDASIPPLEAQLQQNLDALAILIGKPPQGLDIAHGGLVAIEQPAVSPGMPSELLARRPDVAQSEAQLVAANADIRQARAAFFPSIQLTANGGFASVALSSLLEPGSRIYDLAAGLTQPIFHGGALVGEYQFSKARYDELLADYHKAVISAFGNVEDALAATSRTAEQLARQQVAVDKARRAYEFAQAQMRAGTVNILTVLNTETALFSAQDTLAQVKLAHLTALVDLFKALGGGWERSMENQQCAFPHCL